MGVLTLAQDPSVAYRTALTVVDATSIPASVFTGGTIPVLPVRGMPNAYVEARSVTTPNTIGVTPVALGEKSDGTLYVIAVGSELALIVGALDDGAATPKKRSPVAVADVLGARGSGILGGGPVKFLAFVVTTAPTGATSTDLYAWAAA